MDEKEVENKDVDYLIIGLNKKSKPVCVVLEDKTSSTRFTRRTAKKQMKETIFVLCSLYMKSTKGGKNYPRESIAPIVPCLYIERADTSTPDNEDEHRQRESRNSTTPEKRHRRKSRDIPSINMCGMKADLHILGPKSLKNKEDWEDVTNQTTPYWENHTESN